MTFANRTHDTLPPTEGPGPDGATAVGGGRPRPRGAVLAAALLAPLLVLGGLGYVVLGRGSDDESVDGPEAAAGAAAGADQQADAPLPEGPADALSWAPPTLEDPETIEITAEEPHLKLDLDQDYRLVLPDEPLVVPEGVSVYGGRNVVLVGGEIRIRERGDDDSEGKRGLYLRDQTGTVHIEGVALSGDGLGEGINLDQRLGAVVQLQNIHVGEVWGVPEGHHGDLIQTWAGPAELRVDRFSGTTEYQGFFLLPNQFGDQDEPELFDLRRVDIAAGDEGAGYLLWRDDADWPLETTDVWVETDEDPADRGAFLWDREGEDSFSDVQVGSRPDGPFVPEGSVGVGYTSPGYGAEG